MSELRETDACLKFEMFPPYIKYMSKYKKCAVLKNITQNDEETEIFKGKNIFKIKI